MLCAWLFDVLVLCIRLCLLVFSCFAMLTGLLAVCLLLGVVCFWFCI